MTSRLRKWTCGLMVEGDTCAMEWRDTCMVVEMVVGGGGREEEEVGA